MAIKLNDEEKKKLDIAMASINKEYGKRSVYFFDDTIEPVKSVSTGALSLDIALGVGGVPEGRIIEIFGPESAGKSTLCASIVANAQKQGKLCAYIDMEHAIDPGYAMEVGVDFDSLVFSQPSYGEMALEIIDQLTSTGLFSVIVLDSVAALTPKAELEGSMEDQQMGLLARLMSKALRKLTPIAAQNGTTIIFVNQIREKIGIMFGSPETTPGGRALRFASSVRIDLRKKDWLKSKTGEIDGIEVEAKVIKNKVGPPFRSAKFTIGYGSGIDYERSVVETALSQNVMKMGGAGWIKYKDEPFAQGVANAGIKLKEDKALAEGIQKEIYQTLKKEVKDAT